MNSIDVEMPRKERSSTSSSYASAQAPPDDLVITCVETARKALEDADVKYHKDLGTHGNETDVIVSVDHVVLVKKIMEDQDGVVWCYATMLQTIIGTPLKGEDAPAYFEYRFNDMVAGDENIVRRKTDLKTDEDGTVYATTTFSCKFQLFSRTIFSNYPFMIFEYATNIELSSFEYQGVRFRPNMVFHPYTLSNQQVWRHFKVRNPMQHKFDGSINFDFVSPFPSVDIHYHDKHGGYCPEFKIAFYANEPIYMKVVNTIMPLLFVVLLSSINVLAPQETSDFIGNTSGIALTLIFLLPLIYPANNYQVSFGLNEISILLVFVAMIIGLTKTPMNLYAYEEQQSNGMMENLNTTEIFRRVASGNLRDVDWGAWVRTHVVPMISIALSSVIVIVPCVNWLRYCRALRCIKAFNGDFSKGIKNVNIEPQKLEKCIREMNIRRGSLPNYKATDNDYQGKGECGSASPNCRPG